MITLTDTAIEKLTHFDCVVFAIQLPFIVFIFHQSFYKCTVSEILTTNDIHSILRLSRVVDTIKDLK